MADLDTLLEDVRRAAEKRDEAIIEHCMAQRALDLATHSLREATRDLEREIKARTASSRASDAFDASVAAFTVD